MLMVAADEASVGMGFSLAPGTVAANHDDGVDFSDYYLDQLSLCLMERKSPSRTCPTVCACWSIRARYAFSPRRQLHRSAARSGRSRITSPYYPLGARSRRLGGSQVSSRQVS